MEHWFGYICSAYTRSIVGWETRMTATMTASHPVRSRSHRTPRAAGDPIGVPARAPVAGRARPVSERTYRRRRAAVGAVLFGLSAGAVIVGPELVGGGSPAGAVSGVVATNVRVTAQPGDTLWSIAEQHRGDVPIVRYVDALVDLNGGPAIVAGQSVRLP